MAKRSSENALIAIVFTIVIAYVLIATVFREHTLLTSIILGIILVIFIFGLVKFPVFRNATFQGFKRFFNYLIGLITESGRETKAPRVNIPQSNRQAVFNRAEHHCQIHGCREMENLEIHHIDSDRTNPKMNNLILLCQKHHAKAQHHDYKQEQLKSWNRHPSSR